MGVRRRATHVNDFDREPARPSQEYSINYHKEDNAVACEAVLWRDLTYNASTADKAITSRQDIGPNYSKMLSRGLAANQGSRCWNNDVAMRGVSGFGFAQTEAEESVQQLEARDINARFQRASVGPPPF